MNDDDLDRLLALADRATPGPYVVYHPRMYASIKTVEGAYVLEGNSANRVSLEDINLFAALSPATVRELVALARAGLARETGGET